MRRRSVILTSFTAVVTLITVVACGRRSDATAPDPNAPDCAGDITPAGCRPTLIPAAMTMRFGDTVRVRITENKPGWIWIWASGDSTRATVDQTGLVRAVSDVPGVAICAYLKDYSWYKGCASVVVPAR